MKKKELEQFRLRLEEMRAELTKTLKGSTQEVRTPDESKGYSQHQADEGSDDYDRSVSLNLTTREFEILGHIDRALEKMNEGTYGVCDISGKEIPLGRLEAIPYAITTVEAQEMLEKGLLS